MQNESGKWLNALTIKNPPVQKGVMNGKTTLPTKAWRAERDKLTAERNRLNGEYISLKDEVKEVEKIRTSVYDIMREETRRTQPTRKQDMEL